MAPWSGEAIGCRDFDFIMRAMSKEFSALSEFEWNFDAVPDKELVACSYWEYARESAFILDVRRRCSDPRSLEYDNGQEWWKFVGEDLERIESIGYEAEVLLRGFCYDEWREHCPPLTRNFPDPWQSLSEAERRYRSHIRSDVEVCGLVPFKHAGDITTAESLLESAQDYCRQYRAAADAAHAANPGWGETTLRRWRKYPKFEPKASVIWDDGTESSIVQVAWEQFTNEEIVKAFKTWVRSNRPAGVGKASHPGRRKEKGYRDYLAWLGMMRLMSVCPFTSVKGKLPEAWSRYRSADWPRARKKAIGVYKRLFRFLPLEDLPIHARTAGGRAR